MAGERGGENRVNARVDRPGIPRCDRIIKVGPVWIPSEKIAQAGLLIQTEAKKRGAYGIFRMGRSALPAIDRNLWHL
jgi:hypothetical protein